MLRSKLWQTTDAKCADLAACGTLASAVLFVLVFVAPLSAQVPRGPIKPPPSDAPQNAPPGASAAPAVISSKTIRSEISSEPPAIPKDEIIKRFAEREAEFKKERDNYTYTQTVRVQTIDDDGRPDGEYRLTSDIVFTPEGKRYEKITYAPATTLVRVNLEKRDEDDLRNVQPFVLTTAELTKYNVTYLGRQMVDELHTYVFDVAPKTIEKDQRYFQGRVWVDDKDLQIVMTEGKPSPTSSRRVPKAFSRVSPLTAKTLKAASGFPPTPARTTSSTSAAAPYASA